MLPGARRITLSPGPCLHQRARERRHPADVVAIEIDLVETDDAHHPLGSGGVGVANGRSEEDVCRRAPDSRRFRVHYFRGIDSFRQKANAPIDLAQPPFAVLVVGVLAAIAVACRPRDDLCHRRPLPSEQEPELISEPLQAVRRDVVLDPGGLGACGLFGAVVLLVVLVVRFLRERLVHAALFWNCHLIRGEAVEESVAKRRAQRGLRAAARQMGGIPGIALAPSVAVVMPHHRPAVAMARPSTARRVATHDQCAVGVAAGKDVVPVRCHAPRLPR